MGRHTLREEASPSKSKRRDGERRAGIKLTTFDRIACAAVAIHHPAFQLDSKASIPDVLKQ